MRAERIKTLVQAIEWAERFTAADDQYLDDWNANEARQAVGILLLKVQRTRDEVNAAASASLDRGR